MDVLQQTMAILLVFGLLGGSLWWLRRRGFAGLAVARRPASRRLQYLERLPLGPQHMLHLVRVGDAELLLSSSPSGCVLIEKCSQKAIQ